MKNTFKGEIKKGTVRKTNNQFKKFVTQFKEGEFERCLIAINNTLHSRIYASSHLRKKSAVSYDMKEICDVLKSNKFDIIEYNYVQYPDHRDNRVVVKSWDSYNVNVDGKDTECNMIFVLSVTNHQIVTLWYNSIDDDHKTLNMSRYNKNIEVVF